VSGLATLHPPDVQRQNKYHFLRYDGHPSRDVPGAGSQHDSRTFTFAQMVHRAFYPIGESELRGFQVLHCTGRTTLVAVRHFCRRIAAFPLQRYVVLGAHELPSDARTALCAFVSDRIAKQDGANVLVCTEDYVYEFEGADMTRESAQSMPPLVADKPNEDAAATFIVGKSSSGKTRAALAAAPTARLYLHDDRVDAAVSAFVDSLSEGARAFIGVSSYALGLDCVGKAHAVDAETAAAAAIATDHIAVSWDAGDTRRVDEAAVQKRRVSATRLAIYTALQQLLTSPCYVDASGRVHPIPNDVRFVVEIAAGNANLEPERVLAHSLPRLVRHATLKKCVFSFDGLDRDDPVAARGLRFACGANPGAVQAGNDVCGNV